MLLEIESAGLREQRTDIDGNVCRERCPGSRWREPRTTAIKHPGGDDIAEPAVDVAEFRRTGVASRRVADLDVPVAAWRAAMCRAGRRDRARVRTFLLPPTTDAGLPRDQLVFAVRTDPPPDPAVQQRGMLSWWRIAELGLPFDRWRAALHRVARRDHVWVHTFRVLPAVGDRDRDPGELVYVFRVDPADLRQAPAASPAAATARTRRGMSPVTDLADYRAAHSRRAASIARHPSGIHP